MKLYLLILSLGLLMFSGCSSSADKIPAVSKDQHQSVPKASYEIDSIAMPKGLTGETGALEFLPDGRLAACFMRGELMLYNPAAKKWSVFAEGLFDPLGMLAVSDSEFLVMQHTELTRIKDIDGDGHADLYETVTNEFGVTGNYHEFNYGPVRDRDGNLFIALNLASAGGGIRPELRGKFDASGRRPGQEMFSVVPYRGWIMKLTPSGHLLPYAMGFRSPNGLGFDLDGHLLVTDNQGDWKGTSTLYHVREGRFYGHPASLIWKKDWKRGSPYIPVAELDSMRTKASVLFPHGIMADSPTQPLCDNTQGKFGPFGGQIFVGEMNSGRILRVMLENVGGELQGACTVFMDGQGLRKGNNRLAFAPDGSLWVGQTSHGWAGDNGIQRIVFTGKQPMEIYSMQLTAGGFDLTFTKPMDSATIMNPDNYRFRRYYYGYHKEYGSDQMGVQRIGVTAVRLSADRKKVSLILDSLKPGYVYELNARNIKAASGESLAHNLICYTLNRLKK